MASGNPVQRQSQGTGTTSGNTTPGRRRRPPGVLAADAQAIVSGYTATLAKTPLADSTRAKYAARVRGYLRWLADATVDGDPLNDPVARDWAVRDYRAHLKTADKLSPSAINNYLAALDDFHGRRGLGPAAVGREELHRTTAPKALQPRDALRFLRAVERDADPRNTLIALLPYYAGLRIGEVVGLDVDDVRLSARRGDIRVLGKGRNGGKERLVPLHAELRTALRAWAYTERPTWPGASDTPALLLNRRGGRLSDRSARAVIDELIASAKLAENPGTGYGPHALRHTFATQLVRGGTDLVTVAELLGHTRLDTVRIYTLPSQCERDAALDNLISDR